MGTSFENDQKLGLNEPDWPAIGYTPAFDAAL